MKTTLPALLLFVFSLLSTEYAAACGCGGVPRPLSDEEVRAGIVREFDESVAVFSGEVVWRDTYNLKFKVTKLWKGEPAGEIVMSTGAVKIDETYSRSSSCDYGFKASEKYLVFARSFEAGLVAYECTGTKLLADSERDVTALDDLNPTAYQLQGPLAFLLHGGSVSVNNPNVLISRSTRTRDGNHFAREPTGTKRDDAGGKLIFDGKTLDGWRAPDMSYFSVKDGAITGTTTREHNPPENQFIVWQGGTVGDFELRFRFRIFGAKANSGMQFRSRVRERGLVHGYQADIATAGPYLGGIWDEYGTRKSLAARGEKTVIDENGKRTSTRFADAEALLRGINLEAWNEYHIIARGPHITLKINGEVTAELIDRERGKSAASGVLAMPIIPGEPMRVQYKDIRLKTLRGLSK